MSKHHTEAAAEAAAPAEVEAPPAEAAAPAEVEAAPEPKAPKRGVGTVVREAIAAGKDNEAALAAVRAEFPDSKATLSSVSWYRNDMRKADPSIPTGRSVKPKVDKPEKPAKAKAGVPAAEAADPLA